MSDASDPVYVLDELELRPQMLEPFLAALAADYEPSALERGMQRMHTWVTPPFELAEGGTRVLLVWRLEGAGGFWAGRSTSSDPAVLEFWERCERFIVTRSRRYAAEASALPALAAAGRVNE
jgi:hypothetical protein